MKYFIFLIFLLFAFNVNSQDLIFLKSGEAIQSKILEIDSVYVRYQEYQNQSGPALFVAKQHVIMIMYENGKKTVFSENDTESILPNGALVMDFLGLLQYGPFFQYEVRIAEKLYLVPSVRFGYFGLLYNAVWGVFGDKSSYLVFPCAGIGIGALRFSPFENNNALYYGGFIEYGSSKTVWDEGKADESYQLWKGISFIGKIGYRWRYDSGRFLSAGMYTGLTNPISDKKHYVYDPSRNAEYDDPLRFMIAFELSFGWEF